MTTYPYFSHLMYGMIWVKFPIRDACIMPSNIDEFREDWFRQIPTILISRN